MSKRFNLRALAMTLMLVLVAACEPVTRTYSPDEVDFAAQLLEARVKQDIGKQIGDNFRVKAVSRQGSTVTMSFELLDQKVVALARQEPDLFGRLTTALIAKEICGDRNARDLINSGLQINARILSPRGRPLFTSAVKNC